MNEQALARIIEILTDTPSFFVPVKKLWVTLQGEGLALNLDQEAFHTQLKKDDRFEFIEGVDQTGGLEDDPATAAQVEMNMEAQGYYSGPQVKLVARTMTAEDVFAGLSRSLTQLNEALRGAWEKRPDEDEEAETMLREALGLAEQLEKEIQTVIGEQEETERPEENKQ